MVVFQTVYVIRVITHSATTQVQQRITPITAHDALDFVQSRLYKFPNLIIRKLVTLDKLIIQIALLIKLQLTSLGYREVIVVLSTVFKIVLTTMVTIPEL